MTIPHIKITQAHYDAAVDFLFAPKMNKLDIINKAVEIALAEAHAQSEPVDPHAADRIKYAKQVAEGTTGFYLWEYEHSHSEGWQSVSDKPLFMDGNKYRCTDISCMVRKDGEPAIRMLRREAQKLQRELGDTVDWVWVSSSACTGKSFACDESVLSFTNGGTYTYRDKATIKLNGEMVTREQAMAEWESKKDTHDILCAVEFAPEFELQSGVIWRAYSDQKFEFELRPKPAKVVAWTGSRDDVINLLKALGLLK